MLICFAILLKCQDWRNFWAPDFCFFIRNYRKYPIHHDHRFVSLNCIFAGSSTSRNSICQFETLGKQMFLTNEVCEIVMLFTVSKKSGSTLLILTSKFESPSSLNVAKPDLEPGSSMFIRELPPVPVLIPNCQSMVDRVGVDAKKTTFLPWPSVGATKVRRTSSNLGNFCEANLSSLGHFRTCFSTRGKL